MKTRLIVSSLLPENIREALACEGFELINAGKSSVILDETAYHPDMLYFLLPNNKLLISPVLKSVHNFETFCECIVSNTKQGAKYPFDCAFNCFYTKYCLLSGSYTADEIIQSCEELGLRRVTVRQGYAACSTVKLNGEAFITSDKGIAKALDENGHDVLLVSNNGVKLNGYKNGFIGGCAFTANDSVYFTGKIEAHESFAEIQIFCEKHNKKVKSLCNEPLYDYGGFIVLP